MIESSRIYFFPPRPIYLNKKKLGCKDQIWVLVGGKKALSAFRNRAQWEDDIKIRNLEISWFLFQNIGRREYLNQACKLICDVLFALIFNAGKKHVLRPVLAHLRQQNLPATLSFLAVGERRERRDHDVDFGPHPDNNQALDGRQSGSIPLRKILNLITLKLNRCDFRTMESTQGFTVISWALLDHMTDF